MSIVPVQQTYRGQCIKPRFAMAHNYSADSAKAILEKGGKCNCECSHILLNSSVAVTLLKPAISEGFYVNSQRWKEDFIELS